ncbi:hypothetical protein BW723_05925 [Polaribacter reichenbachii]|uniref:Glycosyl hydrolase family 30 TIM-barrel domain-containing protein n=1 Tax=Polaribacter reichenbachii TaxID=996801 RepID=A0A1B8TYL1_9FLAO|nr:hypothetical protein [Polaribacter reichenbachii]APZ45859.1 hypothetical protein BW723_05925 [Polaribacter reichenbachii]AUC19721.1 hypothetical protein BTO17_13940 [Polaribacter reichenbachii]OBY64708.1 hypothetical protein LPB301_09795 [Polaribacter reichenbachii]
MKSRKFLSIAFLSMVTFTSFSQEVDIKIEYVKLNKGEANPVKNYTTVINTDAKVKQNDFIVITPEVEFQTIEGFGGAFNENGGEALFSLSKKAQKEVLNNLFSKEKSNLTFNRTPIGPSDFSIDAYDYSMTPDDYEMKHFSIERDKKYLLPFIKEALAVNSEMLLQASPWSPPAWMKVNNAVDKNQSYEGKSGLKNTPEIHTAYAKYLVNYIKAYKKEGVEVHRFCLQNEPDTYAPFPGCNIPMDQYIDLGVNYVIPKFRAEKLATEIWLGTFRTINRADHYKTLLNKSSKNNFAGIGFQYAKEPFIRETSLLAPEMKIMHTEGICYNGANSEAQAKKRLAEIASYINSGSTNYCYWNIILNETSKSAWNWKQNSLMVINRKTKEVIYTPDYNAIYLASKTVRKDDVRIAHIAKEKIISVKDANGNIKLLIQNDELKEKFIRLFYNDKEINLKVPADALYAVTLSSK